MTTMVHVLVAAHPSVNATFDDIQGSPSGLELKILLFYVMFPRCHTEVSLSVISLKHRLRIIPYPVSIQMDCPV